MSVNVYSTKNYDNNPAPRLRQNKANSNPIRQKPKMNVTCVLAKPYKNLPLWGLPQDKAKQTQLQKSFEAGFCYAGLRVLSIPCARWSSFLTGVTRRGKSQK